MVRGSIKGIICWDSQFHRALIHRKEPGYCCNKHKSCAWDSMDRFFCKFTPSSKMGILNSYSKTIFWNFSAWKICLNCGIYDFSVFHLPRHQFENTFLVRFDQIYTFNDRFKVTLAFSDWAKSTPQYRTWFVHQFPYPKFNVGMFLLQSLLLHPKKTFAKLI